MNNHLLHRAHFNLGLAFAVMAIFVLSGYKGSPSNAATNNVTIDFTMPIATSDSNAFSGTISTYGSGGGNIVNSAKQRAALGSLGLGFYRVPLKWNGGAIISAAGGGPTTISGDSWVANIRSTGGVPMIVLGGSTDNNFTPSDGANMVSHFSGANRVGYWVIGNEPSNGGMSIAAYCTLFNQTVDAMKAVDPTIKVAGPAWAFFDPSTLQSFLNCAGSRVDIIDYHHYAMGTTSLDNATALSQTHVWEDEVNQARQIINTTIPARASQVDIQVGEYNWSWRTANGYAGYNGDDRFYQAIATVWSASVAGHIAKAGGRGNQYSDQNGALGITFETNADATHFGRTIGDPMPIYHGMRMFSGGDLFRKFGTTVVQATTTLPNTEVFASNNSKNVVLINKDPAATQTAAIQAAGISAGTATVWQTSATAPFSAPVRQPDAAIAGGALTVPLPPYSVTTLVINDVAPPTSTPTPSPTPVAPPTASAAVPSPSVGSGNTGRISPQPPSPVISKISGTISVPVGTSGTSIIKVDGLPLSSDKLDTSYLTNGEHVVSIETTAPDGTKKSTTQVINVNNQLTPWQNWRNTLFAPLHGNKTVIDRTLLGLLGTLVSVVGYLVNRRLRDQKTGGWEVRTNTK